MDARDEHFADRRVSMGNLSRAYDALRETANLYPEPKETPAFDDALRAYVKECHAGVRADIQQALANLHDEAEAASDHHMRLVIRLVDEILDPILRGSE